MNDSRHREAPAEPGRYRGRFAPTPSGPLHLGSLLTAVASFLQARSSGGDWLLRIDDLDQPRSRPEHVETIQRQLEAHALFWDEAIHRQSEHLQDYEQALAALAQRARLYRCDCTRARLAAESRPGTDGPVYSGRCRDLGLSGARCAIRIRVGSGEVEILDRNLGALRRRLDRDLGDFVLRRADGQIGYQLASIVDDRLLGITEIVRGADLIDSSLRQRHLADLLGYAVPVFRHLPVLVDARGSKLSKQNHATPINAERASHNLIRCLDLLGQSVPGVDPGLSPQAVLQLAIPAWRAEAIPPLASLPAPP